MEQEIYKRILNDNSAIPVPNYYRLKMDIINKIDAGIWAEHEKLPSENVLCEQYGVSRTTVRKTFDELAATKYIYKIQGKGTYVEEAAKRQNNISKADYGCSEMIRRQGGKPSHRVIAQDIKTVDEKERECLELEIGEQIIEYKRVYYNNDFPVIYAKTCINQKFVPGIERIDFSKTTLSRVLKEEYGLQISRERCIFKAIPADKEISTALGVPLDFPILYRAIVCKARNEKAVFPIEVSQLYYRTDGIKVEIG